MPARSRLPSRPIGEPGFTPSLFFISQAYERTGRLAEAEACLERALAAGENPAFAGFLAMVLARSGRGAEAEEILQTLLGRDSGGWLPAFAVALVYLGQGATAEAKKWLEAALAERSHWLLYANVDPLFDQWWEDDALAAVRNKVEALIKRWGQLVARSTGQLSRPSRGASIRLAWPAALSPPWSSRYSRRRRAARTSPGSGPARSI